MNVTGEESAMLSEAGYEPGYIGDIKEGDDIAIPPTRFQGDPPGLFMLTVRRILQPSKNSRMVRFTADSSEGANHWSYGPQYPAWIRKAQT